MTSVSAVVVHYRGGEHLDRCVASCLEIPEVEETLVIDNEGVAPAIRERHRDRRVRVLAMPANVGFGRGANAGLAAARSGSVLVLNQDVVVARDAVGAMLESGAAARAWLVGPRLVDAFGNEAPPKGRFPPPLDWQAVAADGAGWRDVPWIPGAAMLFMPDRTTLRFDPRIFMYGEDEELCWRVWRGGGRVIVAERARVVHEGGTAASARWPQRAITRRTFLNRARFVRWHAGWSGAARYALAAVRRR